MLIREIETKDAENFRLLIQQVESQSEFMMMESGERQTTSEQQLRQIESLKKQANSTVLVAEDEDQLTGYLFAIGGSSRRNSHAAYLVIGILTEYRAKGVGTQLFQQLEKWAAAQGISRLELTVVIENEAGLALYKKQGFEVEGTKRQSLKINGSLVDEYYMSKLLYT
ncbi:GCN5 family N-acetyltransferase [Jeotgalibacillus malaysiensis]|uniref:GCN5 family N-acetyltransferase n=1 Tax=Jeotgalibacillus malaysiensis TaxID=1508404 RepID=A0A0B5ANP6_9BACL|nr:GNAT family N-acetyltransferase [Jeotgalibacillus malaysiensis]AJD89634.1 GCN5 family N-acetyltransferase [Jeotgalibacillus malaysiensis]